MERSWDQGAHAAARKQILRMVPNLIDPSQTFNYRFEIQKARSSSCWIGTGASFGTFPDFEPLTGSNPTFQLDFGWLSLFPTDGWVRSLPTSWYSDQPRPSSMDEQSVWTT
jgi:hypothetical protein